MIAKIKRMSYNLAYIVGGIKILNKKKLLVQLKDLIEENVKLKADFASQNDVDLEELKREQKNLIDENIRLNREIDKKVKLLGKIDSALERFEKEVLRLDDGNLQIEPSTDEPEQSHSENSSDSIGEDTAPGDNISPSRSEFDEYADEVLKYVQLKVDAFLSREKQVPDFLRNALLQVFDSFKDNVATLVKVKTDFNEFVDSVDKCVYEILDFIKLIDNL